MSEREAEPQHDSTSPRRRFAVELAVPIRLARDRSAPGDPPARDALAPLVATSRRGIRHGRVPSTMFLVAASPVHDVIGGMAGTAGVVQGTDDAFVACGTGRLGRRNGTELAKRAPA